MISRDKSYQLYLEGYARLMVPRHNSLAALHLHNIIRCQFLYVYKRESRQTHKDEEVANRDEIGIL